MATIDPAVETRAEALSRTMDEVQHGRLDEIQDYVLAFAALHTTDTELQTMIELAFFRIETEG